MKITLYYPSAGRDVYTDCELMSSPDGSLRFRGNNFEDKPVQVKTTLAYVIDETEIWEAENLSRFERIREGN